MYFFIFLTEKLDTANGKESQLTLATEFLKSHYYSDLKTAVSRIWENIPDGKLVTANEQNIEYPCSFSKQVSLYIDQGGHHDVPNVASESFPSGPRKQIGPMYNQTPNRVCD